MNKNCTELENLIISLANYKGCDSDNTDHNDNID